MMPPSQFPEEVTTPAEREAIASALVEAQELEKVGRLGEAEAILRSLLQTATSDAEDVVYVLAKVLISRGAASEADELLTAWLAKRPEWALLYLGMALVARDRWDRRQAISWARRADSLRAGDPAVALEIASGIKAFAECDPWTIDLLQEVLRSRPREVYANLLLGLLLKRQSPKKGERYIRRARRSWNGDRAELDDEAARIEAALDSEVRLPTYDSLAAARDRAVMEASAAWDAGEIEGAASILRAQLHRDPADEASRVVLARMLVDSGRATEAIALLERDGGGWSDEEPLLVLVDALTESGQRERAARLLEDSLRSASRSARLRLRSAEWALSDGQPDRARSLLSQAVSDWDGDPVVGLDLLAGALQIRPMDLEQVARLARDIELAGSDDSLPAVVLGIVSERKNQADARDWFARARGRSDDDSFDQLVDRVRDAFQED